MHSSIAHCLASLLAVMSWLGCAHAETGPRVPLPTPERDDAGYLVVPETAGKECLRVEVYRPQPGDLLLYHLSKYEKLFKLAGSGSPMHAAIVFAAPDGSLKSLDITGREVWLAKVRHLDIGPRLRAYAGTIMVRQPRQPLTAEESAALTRFALAQEGKDFALGRLAIQATPLRIRSGLRLQAFGHTYLDRPRWICSEIVIAALANARLVDPRAFPANAMYPRDLAYDERYDLSGVYHRPVIWAPDANPDISGYTVRREEKLPPSFHD